MKENVIEEWFHQYERDVTSFLVYYTGMIDVEDIVQETFLLALKNLPRFRAESHPKTWLISIARNLVNDDFRRRKVWQRIWHLLAPKQQLSNELEARMVRHSEKLELHQAIHRLTPPYRKSSF
ncbi:RNA polymerase sigma factor [Bacillus sp. N9]